jgi:hypothetical protein
LEKHIQEYKFIISTSATEDIKKFIKDLKKGMINLNEGNVNIFLIFNNYLKERLYDFIKSKYL